ncbi:NUDIX hydrolase [Peloplasma aerotolerans]|uniref:NUDIX domain-containing protein n=1 Tax=Peloplasma aerotolerans TaxID=3044389 RepID=A0AAW6U2P2_9MOLU|nr:NUDIX domain-containing protein [Mariniplasma sp. M4Ah]MDI6452160.1 NUDIX domain-containing protein [Mariniplasma sp. M4Ah]MDR4968814.1 NUDIX domain-containing protein [Acholeplasmataceae bacterium]
MRIIEQFDKKNYEMNETTYFRRAVRSIIFKDNLIALVKSIKYGEYKFPGGGIEDGESEIDALIRETTEETGLNIIKESVKPYGMYIEKRKSTFNDKEVFHMESKYYTCNVSSDISKTKLDDYEVEYGYHLCFVTLEEAIENNKQALSHFQDQATWIERELKVLIDLKENNYLSEMM